MRKKAAWYDGAGERLFGHVILLGLIAGLLLGGGWIILKFIAGFNAMVARGFGQ